MAAYVNLMKFTDRGVRHYKETVQRAEQYWATVEKAGGRVLHELWTLGEYDIVVLLDAPDDETAAALTLELGALGNVRTTTLRGFTRDEMTALVARSGR